MLPSAEMLQYKRKRIEALRQKGYNMLIKIDMLNTIIRCIATVVDTEKAFLPPEMVSCLDAMLVREESRHIGYESARCGKLVCRYNDCYKILSQYELDEFDVYCEGCNDARHVQCLYVDPTTNIRCTNIDLDLICHSHFDERDPSWRIRKCEEAEALIEANARVKTDALADAEVFATELAVAVDYDVIGALVEKLVEKLEIICK